MSEILRRLAVGPCSGRVGHFAADAQFRSLPPVGVTGLQIILTALAYALAGGAALPVALRTGIAGWRARFPGGALLGFAIEGAAAPVLCARPLRQAYRASASIAAARSIAPS